VLILRKLHQQCVDSREETCRMNSLKRKKPITVPIDANNKGKIATANGSLSESQSSPSPNVSNSPLESLDHLVDRPYVEYDPQVDDIGIARMLLYLTCSAPSAGVRRCLKRQNGIERHFLSTRRSKTITAGPVTWLHRQRSISSLSPSRPLSICTSLLCSLPNIVIFSDWSAV
jgi:hypothetical protein